LVLLPLLTSNTIIKQLIIIILHTNIPINPSLPRIIPLGFIALVTAADLLLPLILPVSSLLVLLVSYATTDLSTLGIQPITAPTNILPTLSIKTYANEYYNTMPSMAPKRETSIRLQTFLVPDLLLLKQQPLEVLLSPTLLLAHLPIHQLLRLLLPTLKLIYHASRKIIFSSPTMRS
jgi:hypothetical protein